MAAFEYVALDPAGKRTRGIVAADNARAARKELRARRLTLLKLDEARQGRAARAEKAADGGVLARFFSNDSLPTGDLSLITRQLAILIRAGTPVEEALSAVAAQTNLPKGRRILLSARTEVVEGRRFADALGKHPGAFNDLYRSVVAAGEASGGLGDVMERLADFMERAEEIKRKALTATIYPIVLTFVATGIVSALMVFVVPRVVEQFETLGQDLPLLTQIVIAVSAFLRGYGVFVIGGLVAAVIGLRRLMKNKQARLAVHRLGLKVPVIGKLWRGAEAARFARTLATLIASGAPALESTAAARTTLSNAVMSGAVEDIVTSVREGGSLSAAMRRTGAFPPLLAHLAASGEQSGQLADMLEKGAVYLEREFEAVTQVALNLMEPLIILVMGALVATIVLAIMMPILQLNTLAGM